MGVIDSSSEEVRALNGLHVYQFAASNCCQRVRLALAEKGLDWTAHDLNPLKQEQLTPAYQAINPNRVTPTLVHDGTVVIESNDIIEYIDDHFTQVPLAAPDAEAKATARRLMDEAGAFQFVVSTLSHELLFRKHRSYSQEDFAFFESIHMPPEKISFMRDYQENGAAWAGRLEKARRHLAAMFARLDDILGGQPWLNGQNYGLADVSWVVNVFRIADVLKIPLDDYPKLDEWLGRAKARPAFEQAVTGYVA